MYRGKYRHLVEKDYGIVIKRCLILNLDTYNVIFLLNKK